MVRTGFKNVDGDNVAQHCDLFRAFDHAQPMKEIGGDKICLGQGAAHPIESGKGDQPFRIEANAGQLGDSHAAALEVEFLECENNGV